MIETNIFIKNKRIYNNRKTKTIALLKTLSQIHARNYEYLIYYPW